MSSLIKTFTGLDHESIGHKHNDSHLKMASAVPTWMITGTSAGLGLALARLVVSQGHNLISISRHANPPEAVVESLTAIGPETNQTFHHLTIDLSAQHESHIKKTVGEFLSQHAEIQIDVLVNNAGVASFHPLERFPDNALRHTFAVNFFSPLWLIQSVLPHMRSPAWKSNGHEKVIMNVSSTQGLVADASELAYDASKHALESMSATLAAEVAPFGIRVIVASLGSLRTAFATSGDRNQIQSPQKHSGFVSNSTTASESDLASQEDPYEQPDHPVKARMTACMNFAKTPKAARGDADKASRILFSGVMKNPRSAVNEALGQQREDNRKNAPGKGRIERLVLGTDGYPKLELEAKRLQLEIESCRKVVGMADSDDLL